MGINFTPLAKLMLIGVKPRHRDVSTPDLQRHELCRLLRMARNAETARKWRFDEIYASSSPENAFAEIVPVQTYEDIRPDVMRMIRGEKDVLWPGRCRYYAQSSGTSGGKSKYIPVTDISLRLNHLRGGTQAVRAYLRQVPRSRLFAGKAMILGGSFSSTLSDVPAGVRVGDVSASLISHIPRIAEVFRIPDRATALMADWKLKLPALVDAALKANVTNISGVPSWFMGVLKEMLAASGASTIAEIWPNIEVFFHGGISFEPYREQYKKIIGKPDMHYLETYNASEGFFGVQTDFADSSMELIVDAGVYYEFIPFPSGGKPLTAAQVERGKIYELVISAANGLWRYAIGDTVLITSTEPLKIKITGRTKTYINAFGEELMEHNAEAAMREACRECNASVANYTAAPLFQSGGNIPCHQWLIEWSSTPPSPALFAKALDTELRRLNSDYDAKRTGDIFLDTPQIITMPAGSFDRYLASTGSTRLGGQRKVPRLSNTREIADRLLASL